MIEESEAFGFAFLLLPEPGGLRAAGMLLSLQFKPYQLLHAASEPFLNPFSLAFLFMALLMLIAVGVSTVPAIVKIYFFAINFATMVLYFVDKGRAIRDERRIPEAVLHGMCLAGGAPGAELGRRFARHKTLKLSFRLVILLGMMEIMAICAFANGHLVPVHTAVAAQVVSAPQTAHARHHKVAHHEQHD